MLFNDDEKSLLFITQNFILQKLIKTKQLELLLKKRENIYKQNPLKKTIPKLSRSVTIRGAGTPPRQLHLCQASTAIGANKPQVPQLEPIRLAATAHRSIRLASALRVRADEDVIAAREPGVQRAVDQGAAVIRLTMPNRTHQLADLLLGNTAAHGISVELEFDLTLARRCCNNFVSCFLSVCFED